MWLLNPYRFAAAYTPTDANAAAYIAAVEAADGQTLEAGVRQAIDTFVIGCKADGIWNAIKASCILSGARTLAGALVPLVGTAPTNFNFVAGDYNRKTGLVGNGTSKYLNSNRNNNADPQNSQHLSAWKTTIHNTILAGTFGAIIGAGGTSTGASQIFRAGGVSAGLNEGARSRNTVANTPLGPEPPATGFAGLSRAAAGAYTYRTASASTSITQASETPSSDSIFVFARNNGSGTPQGYLNSRLAFYSIGESLDLALLDARVTTLVNAIAAAIP
jgi:hypothetical protein